MLRVWDLFIVGGPSVIYATGVAILNELEDELLKANDCAKVLSVLKHVETNLRPERISALLTNIVKYSKSFVGQ